MLGLFYNKAEQAYDEDSKAARRRATQPPGTAGNGRNRTAEARRGAARTDQALRMKASRYKARNVVSVVVQSITDQEGSSLSQGYGLLGQGAAQASQAGLGGFRAGTPKLKAVKHSRSLPFRDASAESAAYSQGRHDRSSALQSKTQMKQTQSLLAAKAKKQPLIMEISPDPNVLLHQQLKQPSLANKAQIKLTNQARGASKSTQAQLKGELQRIRQKWNQEEALRPMKARNIRTQAERTEARRSTSKRKHAASSLVADLKNGLAREPGLCAGAEALEGLGQAEASAKVRHLCPVTSLENQGRTEDNGCRLAQDTVRNFSPIATSLRTSQVQNERTAVLAGARDSKVWSDSSHHRSPQHPARNKTLKPRQPKREKKVQKKHDYANTHALSMCPSQMCPEWRQGKTPLVQTVKYRADANGNKGQTNVQSCANNVGQTLEGGIRSSSPAIPGQEKAKLHCGSNMPVLNQQSPSTSPLMTSLSSQNAQMHQSQRLVQLLVEQERASVPPTIDITRKADQSLRRGADFQKTLSAIEDKPRKQPESSDCVPGTHHTSAHESKNVLKLKRISEIAEEQRTHVASLAEMPTQNLAQERKALPVRDANADDGRQAPVEDKPQRLCQQAGESSGPPSRTHRTDMDGQPSEYSREQRLQTQEYQKDLDASSSRDGAALLQNPSHPAKHRRRVEENMQHRASDDAINAAMLQGINAHSGSIQSKGVHVQDGAVGMGSKMLSSVDRTVYFNESSEAMGTPRGRYELMQLLNEQQQEPVSDGSLGDGVAPGPGTVEPRHQRTLITLVTAPTARKQQRQTTIGPQLSSSQDASMFYSGDPMSAAIAKRNSNYGQTLHARTEDHQGKPRRDYREAGSKASPNGHRDVESAQILSNRFANSVEYQAGQTSKDTLLSGGEKSAQNQLKFTFADSTNADDNLPRAKARRAQDDDSADPEQQLDQQQHSNEAQGAAASSNNDKQRIAKKQVRIASNYSSMDQAALSRPELMISKQTNPILQGKTKQFKPNQVEPSQNALEKEPQHHKSKSLPDAGGSSKVNDKDAAAMRAPAQGANVDELAGELAAFRQQRARQMQLLPDGSEEREESSESSRSSTSNTNSEGADLDDTGLADKDKDGKDDEMAEIKMKDTKKTCMGKLKELWSQFLFRPSSAFKIKWDIIVIILSIWNSIEIPFEFAFPASFEGATTINAIDKVIDALFVFDILVNFRTMYVDPKTDEMIADPKKISKNYIQGRFWIDLVASIPFEVFAVFFENDDGTTGQNGGSTKGNETTLKIFGMLKLVRLMRLGRMVSFMKTNKSFKLSIILVQLLFILILVIHWIACVWYGVIGLEGGNTWIPPKDVDWDFTIIYTETDFQVYNVFFYYSVLTLVTNELMPTNNIEIFSAICILLTGSLVIGILIGEFSSIMSDMSETANRQNEELDMMTGVMMGLKLPEEIQLNVLDYYLSLQSCKYVHNDQVYDYLNKCITNTVKHFQVENWIIQSQLVHEDNQSLILQFASLTTMEYFQQNEIVIKQNDISDNFYLICEGIVEVAQETNDFAYYDYSKKKKFLEEQIVVNQRIKEYRRKLNQRRMSQRSSQRRKAGVEFDEMGKEIAQFQNVMDIKPFFSNSKDSKDEEEPGRSRSDLQTSNQEDMDASESGFRIINELTEGDYFGEISMVTNLRRTCSVYTVSNGFFAVIGRSKFLELANANVDLKHKLYNKINAYHDENFKASVTMIKNVPQFRPLNQRCLRKIVYRLKDERFQRGQKILRTGEHCDKVYFVKSGRVQVYVKDISEDSDQHQPNDRKRWYKLTTLKAGDCFNFVGAVLQRPAIFEFVSEALPCSNARAQYGQRSMWKESKGLTEQQLEESDYESVPYQDSQGSQYQEEVDMSSDEDQGREESQPLGAGPDAAPKETKYEGGQPEVPAGADVRSQPRKTQPSHGGQRHLPPTESERRQLADLGSKELVNCEQVNQQIEAEAGLAEGSSPDVRVSARSGERDGHGCSPTAGAGPTAQKGKQTKTKSRRPKAAKATSQHQADVASTWSQVARKPSSIGKMLSRSLKLSEEQEEDATAAGPSSSSQWPEGASGGAFDKDQSKAEYEMLDNTAQLYSLSREALMELADMDEHIHNAIVNVKNIYRGQHIKYDYSNLLYKNTKELTVAQHAKDMQEYNEFGELDSHFFFCTSFLQKLRMQMLRKKILKFAKSMLQDNIKMNDIEIFKHVDANYHHFVGRDKNLPLNLILHNGFFNQTSQSKLFKFIERIKEKNSQTARTVTSGEKRDERDLNMNKDKSIFDNEKEYSQFSKQTALNVNTLRRYKEQEHFQQNLVNKPAEALERILEQAMENVQNVDIVRQNVEELHFENYYKLTQLEKWVDKIATQYKTVVQRREGGQHGGAASLQSRSIGQAVGNLKERQGTQALASTYAGSANQALRPPLESVEYTALGQDAEHDDLDQDFALTSPEKTKAMTLAEFKEIEKQAEDLDIDSMLRDVEDIEKKIRKTINQSVAEQEKISIERHLTERQQKHAVDTKPYQDSSKEKYSLPMNNSNHFQNSQNAAIGLSESPEKGQRFTSGTQNNGNVQDKH